MSQTLMWYAPHHALQHSMIPLRVDKLPECWGDVWNTVTSCLSMHPFKYASWLSMHFLAKKIGFKIY